jgi:hypothetical protein
MVSLNCVIEALKAAIEASVYVNPTDPGLTFAELIEVGKRAAFREGELNDALPHVGPQSFERQDRRVLLDQGRWSLCAYLIHGEEPDLRNPTAFDFVIAQLNELTREVGTHKASIVRNILVDRAAHAGISRQDIEVAITLMVLSGQLAEVQQVLRFNNPQNGQGGIRQLPSSALVSRSPNRFQKTLRSQMMPIVRDVVLRRVDGRPRSAEPFDAFAEELERLGYGAHRLWWSQVVGELNQTNPITSPLSAIVLSSALVEAALTFVVIRARHLELGVFGSKDFEKSPRSWRLDDLVAGAARGGDESILDAQTKTRVDGLVLTRQRIHIGRIISDFPCSVPDLKPEEARDARAVAEQVVRRIIEWLQRSRLSNKSPENMVR